MLDKKYDQIRAKDFFGSISGFILFPSRKFSIVNFEHVLAGWVRNKTFKVKKQKFYSSVENVFSIQIWHN